MKEIKEVVEADEAEEEEMNMKRRRQPGRGMREEKSRISQIMKHCKE